MGTVVAQAIMSLDGYVAKPDNTIGRSFDRAAKRRDRDPDSRRRLRRPPGRSVIDARNGGTGMRTLHVGLRVTDLGQSLAFYTAADWPEERD
jgi:hypothetical protein